MPIETEIKFAVADFGPLRRRLAEAGAEYVDRCFEVNRVYDDEARSLKAKGVLLRLRGGRASLLTLKRPPCAHASCFAKVYDECETVVEDLDAAACILEGLGYRPAFAYEKLRETWKLPGVHVCLDTLPFGLFVELEGEEPLILAAADALGLPHGQALPLTYHELNARWRTAAGLSPQESFVFPPEQAARLRGA